MNRFEFDVLTALLQKSGLTQRQVAEQCDISLGAVNQTFKALRAASLITEDGSVTDAGREALEPYRARNAVIMAAGLSSRFAPISYERPKGVLKVRGEVLVERQIRQMMEAGIRDITVVVGYKKEEFFYLEDKFGVKIAVNDEYAERNNNSTIHRVRESLGNTYICCSDTYFSENPFEEYVYESYYSAVYHEGPTDEYCLVTKGKDNRIVNVVVGGSDAWIMMDHAYWNRDFASKFVEILEREYDNPETPGKLWEDIFAEHASELPLYMRKCPSGIIWEFDSLDNLREFDPAFIENVDSGILDNICAVLGCSKSEIHDVYPLKQGLTNLSCHFAIDSGEYVYRHPGVGTEQMIDRTAEMQALELAKTIGIDETFVFEDPEHGWKISRFLVNARELDPHDDAQLAEAMSVARKLHDQDMTLDRHFDYLDESLKYESLLLAKGPIDIPDYQEMRAHAVRARELAEADGAPVCLTHNDFFNLNLLYDEQGRLSLIDWEYAGMSDYASDYGTFVVTCMLSHDEAERALEYYYQRPPTPEERRHNFVFVGLAGWCWYVWSLQKESEGDNVGEWLYTYYKYAKEYLALALKLYGEDVA